MLFFSHTGTLHVQNTQTFMVESEQVFSTITILKIYRVIAGKSEVTYFGQMNNYLLKIDKTLHPFEVELYQICNVFVFPTTITTKQTCKIPFFIYHFR